MSLTKPDSKSTPQVERSLNRQAVLEEEEYTEALSHIIARDFFPSLIHLDATNEYLDALQARDPHLINASVRRLEEISSTPLLSTRQRTQSLVPGATPYGISSQTPSRTNGEPERKRARYDNDLSLDTFQARYTSEDNSSFTQILNEENRVRKEKWAWAWEAQKRVEQQQDKMKERQETMLIEPASATGVKEKFTIEFPRPAGLITEGSDNDKAERETEVTTESLPLVLANEKASKDITSLDVMAPRKDTRSAGVDGWKFKARNSLMFAPDADISPYDPPPDTAEDASVPKIVNYASTRLIELEHNAGDSRASSAPLSPTRSRVNAAITGTPYHPSSSSRTGFHLVPNLPSPTPAELGPKAMKELMTWGTLHSTPRIISQPEDPANIRTPFHIPAISSREAISHKLSNNAAKSLRAKAEMLGSGQANRTPRTGRRGGGMAPPSWTPRRSEAAGNLTPAARRLLERSTMGTAAIRRAESMARTSGWEAKGKERDLDRVRWTPTPSALPRG